MVEDKKMCTRCILDSSISGIKFDDTSVCNFCKIHDTLNGQNPLNEVGRQKLNKIIEEIKRKGKNKDYDCIAGVSGGTDSTYTLYMAKKFGLRPLAVHLDNGWNSEIAVSNIQKAVSKLGVDLYTYVIDWEEFKDLQIAFLKASTPDSEIPTDVGIQAILYRVAAKERVQYILEGHSFRTEGKVPLLWSYGDGRYITSVYKKFGKNKKLKSFPNITITDLLYYRFIKRINYVRPLYYLDYRKEEVKKLLETELGWRDYGGKHYESTYTRFFQSYILPKKFNIDKRKVHYSALVRSGQMTREAALEEIKEPPISEKDAQDYKEYVIKKLGLSEEEFETIMLQKPKTFLDYPTYYPFIQKLRNPIKLFYKLFYPYTPAILYAMDSADNLSDK